jgi:hypothetical protein
MSKIYKAKNGQEFDLSMITSIYWNQDKRVQVYMSGAGDPINVLYRHGSESEAIAKAEQFHTDILRAWKEYNEVDA